MGKRCLETALVQHMGHTICMPMKMDAHNALLNGSLANTNAKLPAIRMSVIGLIRSGIHMIMAIPSLNALVFGDFA